MVNKYFKKILHSKNNFRISLIGMIIVTLGYSLVSFFLYRAGAHPQQATVIGINDKYFFYWGIFFYAPVILSGWLLASTVIYFVSKEFGGKGNFKDTVSFVGIATFIATLGALIPDLIITPFQSLGIINYSDWDKSINSFGIWFFITWVYLLIYSFLFLLLYSFSVKESQKFSYFKSVIIGVIGFIFYQLFLFVFIR